MSGRTFIHINGKQYDASGTTLRPLHDSTKTAMDGIIPNKQVRTAAPHLAPRVPQKAKTIARVAVKKPGSSSHQTVHNLDFHRPQRSLDIQSTTSPAITRFAQNQAVSDLNPVQAPLEGTHYQGQATFVPKKKTDLLIDKQILHAPFNTFAKPKAKKRRIRQKLSEMTPLRRRALSVGAGLAAVLLIGGFIVYNNMPGLSVSIASRQAGFSAMLPEYTPAGFSLNNPVSYAPGRVILNFSSNTNDNAYQIEQIPSGWSTETLREQVASTSGSQYQTFQIKGVTIFFTNNNSATWVDRGVLFSLKGDSGLSGDQIASIAASM